MADLGIRADLETIGRELAGKLAVQLGYTGFQPAPEMLPLNFP